MVAYSIQDVRQAFFGNTAEEYEALVNAHTAGITLLDLIALVTTPAPQAASLPPTCISSSETFAVPDFCGAVMNWQLKLEQGSQLKLGVCSVVAVH